MLVPWFTRTATPSREVLIPRSSLWLVAVPGPENLPEESRRTVAATSPIESSRDVAGPPSSFVIVPMPVPFAIVAPRGVDKITRKVSSVSTRSSPKTGIVTDFVVSPGSNTRVPVVGWKSIAEVADPGAVAKSTVIVSEELLERVALNVADDVVPLSPSVTVASPTESDGTPVARSSFLMVPSAYPSAIRAPAGFDSVTPNRSSSSTSGSPNTFTTMRRTRCPSRNVSRPLDF